MTERLILLPLFVFSALCVRGQAIQSAQCGDPIDAKTEAHQNMGMTVVLQMHAEDDHEKNSHLCMSEYWFSVSAPMELLFVTTLFRMMTLGNGP